MPYPIGILSTGRDEAARTLLMKVHSKRKELDFDIDYVFSNMEHGESEDGDRFLSLVDEIGIPRISFSSRFYYPDIRSTDKTRWRDMYHREAMNKIQPYRRQNQGIDVALGYMLITSNEMAKAYNIVNLHPALPDGPKGTWQDVVWELMESGASQTGTMMHRLTRELDRGPPVTYCRVPIGGMNFHDEWYCYAEERGRKSLSEMKKKYPADAGKYPTKSHPLFVAIRESQFATEVPLVLHTIGEFARGSISFDGEHLVTHDGERIIGGYDITGLVRRELAGPSPA